MKANIGAIAFVAACLVAPIAWANHPVLVEGNCDSPVPGTTLVAQGTCGDYDGDGRIGTAEDTDGADRIFGTISAALGPGTGAAAGTGANQNGTVTIVTSGRFAEQVTIDATGNVTLQAAPGVEAIIDAVRQGDPAGGNGARRTIAGILVRSLGFHTVILRNLTVRNWATGVYVFDARAAIEGLQITNNVNYGIFVSGTSRLSVSETKILFTGYRVDGLQSFPSPVAPNPGAGINFSDSSVIGVFKSEIRGSVGPGIRDQSSGQAVLTDTILFDNNP